VLHLDANGIGYDGMHALANSTCLKSLTTLNLTYNRIDVQGLELMRDSERFKNMKAVKTDLLIADD